MADKPSLRSTESQDTLLSLQQLEPSPIESPFESEKQLPDLPPQPLARSSTLGLSGSGYGAVYYLTRLQRYSSYVFTIYTAAHITNVSILPLITQSVPASETYLLLTRPYYQSFPLEPLLITLPLVTHIVSGLALRIHRRNTSVKRYGTHSPHSWPVLTVMSMSGYVLAPLVMGHMFVNRLLPLFVEGSSSGVGLGFVSHGFGKHPFIAWTGYAALIGVFSGHVVWGWAKWLNWAPIAGSGELSSKGKTGKRRWWTLNGLVVGLTALWAAGGLGIVGRGGKAMGWIAKNYDNIYARVPLLGL